MKRLLPIYPKPASEQRRSIQPMTAFDQQVTVGGAYVILIPMTIKKRGQLNQVLHDYICEDDMNHIKALLRQLVDEEDDQRSMAMDALHRFLPISDADNDRESRTGSSIPTTRRILVDDYISSSHDRLMQWIIGSEINFLESQTMFFSDSH